MKARPILMSAPMVRAILAGTKTQTRRVVKPVGDDDGFVLLDHGNGYWPYRSDDGESSFHTVKRGGKEYLDETPHACPYGEPGDRLWVRENGWERPERTEKMMRDGADTWPKFAYDADGWGAQDHADFKAWGFKRRPSIHMPRWAARILLEVVSVRVERLNSITVSDAIAEGYDGSLDDPIDPSIKWYSTLWESLNGTDSWDANSWVWVVEFKRVKS